VEVLPIGTPNKIFQTPGKISALQEKSFLLGNFQRHSRKIFFNWKLSKTLQEKSFLLGKTLQEKNLFCLETFNDTPRKKSFLLGNFQRHSKKNLFCLETFKDKCKKGDED